jgi:hypothetical protein
MMVFNADGQGRACIDRVTVGMVIDRERHG